jgi:hypothetical protein
MTGAVVAAALALSVLPAPVAAASPPTFVNKVSACYDVSLDIGCFALSVDGLGMGANDDVYTSSGLIRRVKQMNSAGTMIRNWGPAGTGYDMNSAGALAIAPGGDVLIAGWDYIYRFSSAGVWKATYADMRISAARAIAVSASGNIYVAVAAGIVWFNSGGTYMGEWTVEGGFGGVALAVGTGASEDLYVSDRTSNKIHRYSPTGGYIGSFGSAGTGDGQFNAPEGVAVAPDGDVYVVDAGNSRVQRFTSTGTFVTKWGSAGYLDGQFNQPIAIAIGASGDILVGESTQIKRFRNGTSPTAVLTPPATPTKAATLTYALAFNEPVTGLSAADFTRTGTATGCVVGTPAGSGAAYTVPVTGCSQGTVILALDVNTVTTGAPATGPTAPVAAAAVTIDRTGPSAVLTRPATPTNATALTFKVTFSEPSAVLDKVDLTRTGTATGCVVGTPVVSGVTYTVYTVPVTGCSAGTVILTLKANTVADEASNTGPAAAVASAAVTIDRTIPTATAPVGSVRTGVPLAGTAIPVKLTWTGADTGGAGILRYELARSTNGGTTWAAAVSIATATYATTVPGTAGTVRFRVRAVDKAGNAGAWKTGPILTPRLVQGATRSTGTWGTTTSAAYSGGSTRYASTARASATYTFTGRSVALVTTRAASRGSVKVYVDGVLAGTVSTTATTTAYRSVVWSKTFAASGAHTVKLVVAGTAGHPRVDLDAFAVLK